MNYPFFQATPDLFQIFRLVPDMFLKGAGVNRRAVNGAG
jgi:hypothetical protein